MWKAFSRDTWLAIFDIIEFTEATDWAKYYVYINLSDFRRLNGRKWVDYILNNKPDKSLLRDLIKAVEFQECMDLFKAIKVKRWILDKP